MTDTLTISIENLAHFQCPHCKGWWSVGDAPEREYWFCTWCGEASASPDSFQPEEPDGEGRVYEIPEAIKAIEPMVQVWDPGESKWIWKELRDSPEPGGPFHCGT